MIRRILGRIENFDKDISGRIMAYEGGKLVNMAAYTFSSIFMEELILGTVFGLHFFFEANWNHTKCYLLTFGAGAILTVLSKKFFSRTRPDLSNIEHTTKSRYFRSKQSYNASFPSGDTIQAWILLAFSYYCLPVEKFYCVVPLGLFVPLSRIYLGCHYLGDVLAGAAFGWFATSMTLIWLEQPGVKEWFNMVAEVDASL